MARRRGQYRRGRRRRNRGFASWSIGKKIAAILGGTAALVAFAGVAILASKLSKINMVKLDPEKLNVTEPEEERGTGYLNVALFGVDSRENELEINTRSDTIMIASLNRETMEVKISSIYRDTMMEQADGTLNKANTAYAFGGPEDAIAMLNKNLDMDIEHYVTVNFNSLIDVIDALGGVEIDVQEEEINYINGYATEIIRVTGKDSIGVDHAGLQNLNGVQATAYSRIRYTAGDDFKRAERQRDVLSKIVEKAQNASLLQLNEIIDRVFPEVSTNFTLTEILGYAKDALDYKLGEMTGFPFDKTTDTLNNIGSVVIPVTLESNVEKLHTFFFGEEAAYTPSANVVSIGNKIVAKAGDREADTDESTQEVMEQPEESYDYTYGWEYGGGSGNGSDNNTWNSGGNGNNTWNGGGSGGYNGNTGGNGDNSENTGGSGGDGGTGENGGTGDSGGNGGSGDTGEGGDSTGNGGETVSGSEGIVQ